MNYGADGILASKFLDIMSRVNWDRATSVVQKATPIAQSLVSKKFANTYAPSEAVSAPTEVYVPEPAAVYAPQSATPVWVWPVAGLLGVGLILVVAKGRKK